MKQKNKIIKNANIDFVFIHKPKKKENKFANEMKLSF